MPPIFAVPDGNMRFCAFTALTTSLGVSPRASNAGVSISTEIWRDLPPKGKGIAAPGIVTKRGRKKLNAVSNSAASVMLGLEIPSWITGIAEAEYLITSGGSDPGGSERSCCCSTATTCAIAVGILAFG